MCGWFLLDVQNAAKWKLIFKSGFSMFAMSFCHVLRICSMKFEFRGHCPCVLQHVWPRTYYLHDVCQLATWLCHSQLCSRRQCYCSCGHVDNVLVAMLTMLLMWLLLLLLILILLLVNISGVAVAVVFVAVLAFWSNYCILELLYTWGCGCG